MPRMADDHRHAGIAHAQHHVLQLLLLGASMRRRRDHEGRQHRLQVGADREHLVGRPDHQALVFLLGQLDRLQQALGHVGADGVHLGLMLAISTSPSSVQRRTSSFFVIVVPASSGVGASAPQHALGEQLARVHRQHARRHELACASRSTSLRACARRRLRPPGLRTPTPAAARCDSALPASMSSWIHLRDLRPAGFLPQLERALLHAEAPAHREVDVARASRRWSARCTAA